MAAHTRFTPPHLTPSKKAREAFLNAYTQLRKTLILAPEVSAGAAYACHHKTGYGHPYAGQPPHLTPSKKACEALRNACAQLRKTLILAPKISAGATYACHHKTGYGHPYAGLLKHDFKTASPRSFDCKAFKLPTPTVSNNKKGARRRCPRTAQGTRHCAGQRRRARARPIAAKQKGIAAMGGKRL